MATLPGPAGINGPKRRAKRYTTNGPRLDGARRIRVGGLVVRAVSAVAALSTLAGCSSPGDDPGPALPVDPAAIYAQMCARCHGPDGRGDPELKKTLPVRNFTDPAFLARASSDQIARTIMAGKNQMPAFGGLLSVPKIQSLSGFVRRLGRGQVSLPAAAPGEPVPAAP